MYSRQSLSRTILVVSLPFLLPTNRKAGFGPLAHGPNTLDRPIRKVQLAQLISFTATSTSYPQLQPPTFLVTPSAHLHLTHSISWPTPLPPTSRISSKNHLNSLQDGRVHESRNHRLQRPRPNYSRLPNSHRRHHRSVLEKRQGNHYTLEGSSAR